MTSSTLHQYSSLCAGVLVPLALTLPLASCVQRAMPGPTSSPVSAVLPVNRTQATPRPTPTPDPLIAIRRAQLIPNWAKRRVIHEVPLKPGAKLFALTFDDGPWPIYTREILRVLGENKVKATFFMVGEELSRRPEIAREVRDAGHAIGSHSWDHPARPRDPVAQIRNTDAQIHKILGMNPTLFRPPYGLLKNGMAHQAMRENNAVIIWSADCADWKRPGAAHIARMIIGQAHPGGIALMHDGGGNRAQTVAALPTIIKTLRARGYRFVTVPELLHQRYLAPPKPKKPAAPKGKKVSSHKPVSLRAE